MNALKIAKYIEKAFDAEILKKAATMLRQQQEQIKEKDACLKLLEAEIESLHAQLKEFLDKEWKQVNYEFESHPVKELADEDISHFKSF